MILKDELEFVENNLCQKVLEEEAWHILLILQLQLRHHLLTVSCHPMIRQQRIQCIHQAYFPDPSQCSQFQHQSRHCQAFAVQMHSKGECHCIVSMPIHSIQTISCKISILVCHHHS